MKPSLSLQPQTSLESAELPSQFSQSLQFFKNLLSIGPQKEFGPEARKSRTTLTFLRTDSFDWDIKTTTCTGWSIEFSLIAREPLCIPVIIAIQ